MGVVSIVALIQTVDGFFFEAGEFLRRSMLYVVQSSLGDDILVKSVPHIQSTSLQQVKVARVAGQTFSHNWRVAEGAGQYNI